MSLKLETVTDQLVKNQEEKCYICLRTPKRDLQEGERLEWIAHHIGSGKLGHFFHKKCMPLDLKKCGICLGDINPRSLLSFPERVKCFISDHRTEFLKTALGVGAIAGMYLLAPAISEKAIRHGALFYDLFNSMIETPSQFAPHTYQLITSMDFSFYAPITAIALYYSGFFGKVIKGIDEFHTFLCFGKYSYLTRAAIQFGICGPEHIFYWSCNVGNIASSKLALEILLKRDIPQRQLGYFLSHAIKNRAEVLVDFLIDYGAPLNLSGPGGFVSRENIAVLDCEPTLLTACRSGNSLRIVQKLVGKGADITREDSKGNNVLHLACDKEKRDLNLDVLNYLLSFPKVKEKINAKNHKGKTPLFLLPTNCSSFRDLLLKNGADIKIPTEKGFTLLDKACFHNNYDNIHFYVQKGLLFSLAKRVQQSNILYTFEISLLSKMSLELIELLINKKILDLFYVDPQTKDSLLHIALIDKNLGLAGFLLKKIVLTKKNPLATLKNNAGKTVIQLFIEVFRNLSPNERNFEIEQEDIKKLCSEAGFNIIDADVQAAQGDPNFEKIFLDPELKQYYKHIKK